jgi:hypothetical protein
MFRYRKEFLLQTSQERAWIAQLRSHRIMFKILRRLLFWEMVRETKSPRPLCRNQEVVLW